MSHIPSSAMPHAMPHPSSDADAVTEAEAGEGLTLAQRAEKLADLARDNPKTALAAGAAVVAGAIAAAAIPLARAAKKKSDGKKGGASKKRS